MSTMMLVGILRKILRATEEGDSVLKALERAPESVSDRDKRWLSVWLNVMRRVTVPGAIAAVTLEDPNYNLLKSLDFVTNEKVYGISSTQLLEGWISDANTTALRRALWKEPTLLYELVKRLQRTAEVDKRMDKSKNAIQGWGPKEFA